MKQPVIAFIGAGNMSQAIFGGLIKQGYDPACIWASSRTPENLQQLTTKYGIQTSTNNLELVKQADVVILAVKPQGMQTLLAELTDSLQQHQPLLISVAAGITMDALDRWSGGGISIVRCMPNTPSLLQCGASGLYANAAVTVDQRQITDNIFRSVGIVSWVDKESLIDAVIAVSGSGPAYYFMIMEAMIDAGIKLGLPAQTAAELTMQTALGAARMAQESDVDAGTLKRRVMSPGGTTEQAIFTLEEGKLPQLIEAAMQRCAERADEMAQQLTK